MVTISERMIEIIERAEQVLRDANIPFTPYQELIKELQQPKFECNQCGSHLIDEDDIPLICLTCDSHDIKELGK